MRGGQERRIAQAHIRTGRPAIAATTPPRLRLRGLPRNRTGPVVEEHQPVEVISEIVVTLGGG